MKKIIVTVMAVSFITVFCGVAFSAGDLVSGSMSAKDWAELAKVIMQKAKSGSGQSNSSNPFGGSNGLDVNTIIGAINTLKENSGNLNSLLGDGTVQTQAGHAAAVSAINGSTMKLYGQLAKSGQNLFFSPYSISTAMAMVYAGARGSTATEMEQALGYTPTVHASMGSLMSQINSISPDIAKIHVANAIWPAADKNILSDYRNRVATDYKSEITTLDYGNTEMARSVINKWVAGKTEGKIQNIVTPGAISKDTPLSVTNAIYFKSDWESKFETASTAKADFFGLNGATVKTDFMNQIGHFDYLQSGDVEVAELPYKAERLSMYIILPAAGKFDAVERNLTGEQIDSLVSQSQASKARLAISIPKFKMEEDYNLSEALKKLGMPSAFTGSANFSGMDGLLDIAIGTVLHKTFLDVNEAGTEAAAATFVGMKSMSTPERPKEFKANRPFIFVIRDNTTGANLFIGRYVKP